MPKLRLLIRATVALLVVPVSGVALSMTPTGSGNARHVDDMRPALPSIPAHFVANGGQWNARAAFGARW